MRKMIKLIVLSQAALLLPAIITVGVNAAAPRLVEENRKEVAKQSFQLGAATTRTIEEMMKAEATMQPPRPREVLFRPKVGLQQYNEMKIQAQQKAQAAAGRGSAPQPLAPPVLRFYNFDGTNQTLSGGWYPPDTHGAAGFNHFVEVTNSHVDMYRKSTQGLERSVSLNAFFGYFEEALFDPRCMYDRVWGRFVITAEGFQEADGDQWHFIGISKTNNPLAPWIFYAINVGALYGGDFWDFPQLGMTQDAIIITAHLFGATVRSGMMTFAKARVYNGLGVTFNWWDGLAWNLTPSITHDSEYWHALVCADGYAVNTGLFIYYLENAENPAYVFLSGPYFIDTPDFFFPANAAQPGTTELLDSSDCRFINAGTQVGHNLYQVHTNGFGGAGGLATPTWYQIDWWLGAVTTADQFWASGLSADFNASIVANDFEDVYVTWTSTDSSAGTNAQVRISGRRSFDPPDIGGGSSVFTSPTNLTGNPAGGGVQRWGDYSAVSIDPAEANQLRAWVVNEKINAPAVWGSRITRIGF